MRSWFTIFAIPFVEGTMTQEMDPETGAWVHRWEVPASVVLQYQPLSAREAH